MSIFMCRWPNGDLSYVHAPSKEDAIIALDQWDNAELAEITRVSDFMVDFRLNSEGELELQEFGEALNDHVWGKAFPILTEARRVALADGDEPTNAGKEMIHKAVQQEKERLVGKKRLKTADTELGKSIQKQTGAPAVLVNRYVKRRARQVLEHSSTTGRKQ
jgi:stress response protein YsnF